MRHRSDLIERLRAAMVARSQSRAEAAEEIGCSQAALSRWLSGRRTPSGLYARAVAGYIERAQALATMRRTGS